MKFIIDANDMSREDEVALEKFLEKGDYEWECKFEPGEE